jgi:hypothetical protein
MDILHMFNMIEQNPQMLQQLAASGQDPQAFIHALRQTAASQQGGIGGALPVDPPQDGGYSPPPRGTPAGTVPGGTRLGDGIGEALL